MVEAVAFSPDGKLLVSGSSDETIRFWDPHNCQHLSTVPVPSHVYVLAFSPDGSILVGAGQDEKIYLWDPVTGAQRAVLNGHTCDVDTLAFNPDGRTFASGSTDGTILIWDLATVQSTYNSA